MPGSTIHSPVAIRSCRLQAVSRRPMDGATPSAILTATTTLAHTTTTVVRSAAAVAEVGPTLVAGVLETPEVGCQMVVASPAVVPVISILPVRQEGAVPAVLNRSALATLKGIGEPSMAVGRRRALA